jgi:EYA(Eyes Absent) family protein
MLANRPGVAAPCIAHSHSLATRNKWLLHAMTLLRARLQEAVAQLVLLPVVGVSLCGAVTLMLGLQWVEALQRQRQALQWRARLWAALLALLLSLLPSKRLEAAVAPAGKSLHRLEKGARLENAGDKKDAHDGERYTERDQSYASRPLKRQRSDPGDSEQGDLSARKETQDGHGEAERAKDEDGEGGTLEQTLLPATPKKPRVRKRVFIWDLDETLVLFASLYTGTFAQTHGKEVAPGVALGEQMMTFLLAMLEKHFFFGDLHNVDVDHIAHVAVDASRDGDSVVSRQGAALPLAQRQPTIHERYERIREIYERRGDVDFLHDSSSEWFAIRCALVAAIDSFSMGWLHEARQVLELIADSAHARAGHTQPEANPGTESDEGDDNVENVNVLVTNTQLVPALCKCLIYQLDTFFPIERVYSSAKVHKYRCFETIMEKYDAPDVEFVAIGDGLEEEQVSLALGLEFHKIRSLVDLKRLRYDLQLVQVNSSSNAATPTAAVVDSPAVAAAQMSVASSPVGQTAVV